MYNKLLFILFLFNANCINAQTILYKNNFESPITTPNSNGCGAGDYDAQSIDKLYDGTGTHPKSSGHLKGNCVNGTIPNCNSAEVMVINGVNGVYSDPSGKSGKYCIGLQSPSNTFNDLLGFEFNPDNNGTVNLSFDLSASTIVTCNNGSPLSIDSPKIKVRFFRTTGFDIDNINQNLLISSVILDGLPKTPNNSDAANTVMSWKSLTTSMNTIPKDSTKPASSITAVFELIDGRYAVVDNITIIENSTNAIESIDQSNSISIFPNPVQELLNIQLKESFTALSHFEIINIDGTVMISQLINQSSSFQQVILETLPTGTYSLMFKNENDEVVAMKRFIKAQF